MAGPNICVVIPVFNHALTVGRVAREAQAHFPVVIVDDGSTDETAAVLSGVAGAKIATHSQNQGKGVALRSGFAEARRLGFTHAITIDADGQHSPEELPRFGAAVRERPDQFIIGVRDLKKEGAPFGRRVSNDLSTFWFKVETGEAISDTQCGYRCYPLEPIDRLRVKALRYDYELEVMVKAAWAGIPLAALPVSADYRAATSRLSHFDPWRDMARISLLHSKLSTASFCVPAMLRKLSATGQLHELGRKERAGTIVRLLFSEYTETPGQLACAVGIGLFCGIAPIWGFQIITATALAHKLRLNKAIAVAASHISFPLAAPFIMAAGLLVGHYLHTGSLLPLQAATLIHQIPLRFAEWFFGSIVLGAAVGVLGTGITWAASWLLRRNRVAA